MNASKHILLGDKMKNRVYLIFAILIVSCLQISWKHNEIMNKVYPNAYDIKEVQIDNNILQTSYKINDPYPSVKVYQYYNTILKKNGYKEVNWEKQHLTKWFSFIDGTQKNHAKIFEFRAIWADDQQKTMFTLSLRYQGAIDPKLTSPNSTIQHVYFQKRPYLNLEN